VANDGSLWAWGDNSSGQLGDGTTTDKSTAVLVAAGLNKKWAAVSAGNAHTLALAIDGTLWAWGNNIRGQLGDGTSTRRLEPVAVATNRTWTAVGSGNFHTLAMASDGALWAWGDNAYGQLGDGTTETSLVPVPVAVNTKQTWTAISVGVSHNLALASDGTMWAWGNNYFGQLGDGTTAWGRETPKPVATNLDLKWTAISAGANHTMALATDGTLWTCGDNFYGQLGIGPWAQVLGGAVWGPPATAP